jgi:hypothetical protein
LPLGSALPSSSLQQADTVVSRHGGSICFKQGISMAAPARYAFKPASNRMSAHGVLPGADYRSLLPKRSLWCNIYSVFSFLVLFSFSTCNLQTSFSLMKRPSTRHSLFKKKRAHLFARVTVRRGLAEQSHRIIIFIRSSRVT